MPDDGLSQSILCALLPLLQRVFQDAQTEIEAAAPIPKQKAQPIFALRIAIRVAPIRDCPCACNDHNARFAMRGAPVRDAEIRFHKVRIGDNDVSQQNGERIPLRFRRIPCHTRAGRAKSSSTGICAIRQASPTASQMAARRAEAGVVTRLPGPPEPRPCSFPSASNTTAMVLVPPPSMPKW